MEIFYIPLQMQPASLFQVWIEREREVYKDMRISTVPLLSSPDPSQCQLTLTQFFSRPFPQHRWHSCASGTTKFSSLGSDPTFYLFSGTSWSVLKEDFVGLQMLVEEKGHTGRKHNRCISWGWLSWYRPINHQIRPQSTAQVALRRTEMPAGQS